MTRRNAVRKLKANPTPAGPHDIVRQSELREALDLYHRAQVCASRIRARLEAGAEFERGPLGCATWAHDAEGAIDYPTNIEVGGIDIGPAEYHIELRTERPQIAAQVWA